MKARAKMEAKDTSAACIIPPDSKYRGAQNQLYRVEIHKGNTTEGATFKWSRENGSVVFPIVDIDNKEGKVVTLENLGKDDYLALKEGDWVEVVDDDYILQGKPAALLCVTEVDRLNMQVTLDAKAVFQPNKHHLLRRWDQQPGGRSSEERDLFDINTGTIKVIEGTGEIIEGESQSGSETGWITLENGVQIQFQQPRQGGQPTIYRPGDYWLIPARTITADVEWPRKNNDPNEKHIALPPHGVEHHYAPLAIIEVSNGSISGPVDLRNLFSPLPYSLS